MALFLVLMTTVALLLVPRLMAFAPESAPPQVHVVEQGETLWGVAVAHGRGDPRHYVDGLLRVNELSSPQIRPGQALLLP